MREYPELLYNHDIEVKNWVAAKIPDLALSSYGFQNGTAIGVESKSAGLMAGVVYHEWIKEHGTIQLSIASVNAMWARPEIIKLLLSYPFHKLGVHKAWIVIDSTNINSLRLTKSIGFKFEALLHNQFGKNKDAVFKRMYRTDFERIYGGVNELDTSYGRRQLAS